MGGASEFFIRAGDGHKIDAFPGVELLTSACRQMMVSQVRFEPGAVVPDHAHPHEQVGVLVSGRLRFTIGGETQVLSAGDCWRIPGGVRHRVEALDEPALAIDVFHPIREDYLPSENSGEAP